MKKNINNNNNNNLNQINRVSTNIKGFDNLIENGFPNSSNILLSGTYGSGKTIFSLQYIYNGIKYHNEKGIYFTFEEKKENLIEQAKQFNWDLEKEEKKGNLKIISIGTDEISKHTIDEMIEIIKNTKSNRCVIDSITTLSYISPDNFNSGVSIYSIKRFLYSFITKFNSINNLTTLFISQMNEKESNYISKYLCDGVIEIKFESMGGEYSRTLQVTKMRKTKNNENTHPMEIKSKEGIIVHRF